MSTNGNMESASLKHSVKKESPETDANISTEPQANPSGETNGRTKRSRKKQTLAGDNALSSNETSAMTRRSKRLRRSQRIVDNEENGDGKPMDDDAVSNADKFADADENKSDNEISEKGDLTKMESKNPTSQLNERLECPYCQKAFKTPNGFTYHVDNYVCRPAETESTKNSTPTNRVKTRAKPSRGSSSKKKSTSNPGRNRGTKEERTCPHCDRVFTSILGATYHIEQRVCRRKSLLVSSTEPFPTLEPGRKFVTRFGVVEVVKDDRNIPSATLPEDIKKKSRLFKKRAQHRATMETSRFIKCVGKLRLRRNAIQALYEKGKVNQRSIFEAYFGGDPKHMKSVSAAEKVLAEAEAKKHVSSYEGETDPKEPEESFPDRIVECIWISDQRSHILGKEDLPIKRNANEGAKKLFLQRRLLIHPYDENDRVHYCSDCGQSFGSTQARRAHCGSRKCQEDALQKTKKRKDIEFRIRREVSDLRRFPKQRKYIKKRKADDFISVTKEGKKKYRAWKKKKSRETSVYPEVVIGMGFKVITKQAIAVPKVVQGERKPIASLLRGANHEMDVLLADLKASLKVQKRVADDQKYGSMYAEVYKGLGFRFPGKKKVVNVGNNIGPKKRRKRAVKLKPPPPPKPLPPAIDVGALVDEIRSGRYPSIKVFEGEHEDYCLVCKEGGDLLCCEYCNKVEHFKCILSKFTIKMPEPDEDFMCHKCIGVILSRRNRAEKRRLRKQAKNEQQNKEKEEAEAIGKTSKGMEYPYMATQAREANELVELLKDAQVRLRRSIETTKLNNLRRKVIAGIYPEKFEQPYL